MYTYVRMHIPACWRSSIAQWLRTQALEPDFLGPNPGCATCELYYFLHKQSEPEESEVVLMSTLVECEN